ncbi:MAG: TonB-dependent receptor plug domain-containing protein [bacterium]
MSNLEVRARVQQLLLIALVAGCSSAPKEPAEPSPVAAKGTLTAQDVANSPNVPIEQLLQSKVAGIVVNRTDDGGIAIRIRGTSSFSGNNAPLYIVDGIPVQTGANGGLVGINPYDIASIKVLKEPTDITMYGARGANGVIIIKTKKP